MVNPHAVPAVVNLVARHHQGATVAARSLVITPRQQISQFVTELFAGDPAFATAATGLLFIASDLPIGVLCESSVITLELDRSVSARLGEYNSDCPGLRERVEHWQRLTTRYKNSNLLTVQRSPTALTAREARSVVFIARSDGDGHTTLDK